MALGKTENAVDGVLVHDIAADSKDSPAVLEKSIYDAEKVEETGRKMTRVCSPIRPAGSDDSSTFTVGKLQELEAANTIKYRTCSWQKVNSTYIPFSSFMVAPKDGDDSALWASFRLAFSACSPFGSLK